MEQFRRAGRLHTLAGDPVPGGDESGREAADAATSSSTTRTRACSSGGCRRAVRIAGGDARVLAIAGDLVAWSGADGTNLHITNLGTGETVDTRTGLATVTSRFSPDRSRLAILSGDSVTESMTLVDTASGAEIAYLVTASGGNGLAQFDDVPPAFQPVPFGWDATGRLVVIAQTTVGYFVRTVDSASGAVVRSVAAPEGLQQLVPLAP